ncbi:synaptonemal complex central element protein 3 [Amphiprion ocellaris]|uniref:Synaptonemal complex central element protein 3 n=2 Tax=Amphiprion TaxID=80969 RepID=A0AAQ5X8D3_AMPOC|nr:synaptonemal complex central element protein 3 [Amphiprion ocellaris]XP_023153955.1 synaptonemal complex central element protein 3 [Amphiprion ocellaris]
MVDSPSSHELPRSSNDDLSELNKDLERMIEDAENMSVQLTWMAYDMVVLRTTPELGDAMKKLEEAYHRCRDALCGDPDQKPEMDNSS